ncbi:MAG: ATP-binding protein [Chloroflexota bacterium]|nr:ATP-binding protein [Chloroflexota bacterium]
MSIRLRLTAWYVLTLAIALGAVAFALIFVFRTAMERQLDDELAARAAQVVSTIQSEGSALALQRQDGEDSLVVGGEFVGLYDPSGKLVDSSVAAPQAGAAIASFAAGSPTTRSETLTVGAEHLRVRAVPVADRGQRVGTVAIVRSLTPIDAAERQLLGILGLAVPLAIVIAAVGGYLLAYRALRPVEQLRRAAEDYGATDLTRRLAPREVRDDELGRLARTLDEMLDRVAVAVEQRQRFTGDASHELRTPIATILADASLSLERPRTAEDYHATIARIASETARMARIVEGLLVLARADARSAPAHSEDVDLAELLGESVRRAAPGATERGVEIASRIQPGLVVTDHDGGLERVFDNLLENAVRSAPGGTLIEIAGEAHDGMTRVSVSDHGPGIPPEERSRVFERFHRTAGSSGSGAGLGLAIAREIMEAHKGAIGVKATPGGGATFVVELPASSRRP